MCWTIRKILLNCDYVERGKAERTVSRGTLYSGFLFSTSELELGKSDQDFHGSVNIVKHMTVKIVKRPPFRDCALGVRPLHQEATVEKAQNVQHIQMLEGHSHRFLSKSVSVCTSCV